MDPNLKNAQKVGDVVGLGIPNPDLRRCLTDLGIKTNTVAYRESGFRCELDSRIFCKNLFLKDRKGEFYFIICREETDVDFKQLKKRLNACRNFSFASPAELFRMLKTHPGCVSPFSFMHSSTADVRLVIDDSLCADENYLLNFHPFDARLTTQIRFKNILEFLRHFNKVPEIMKLVSKI